MALLDISFLFSSHCFFRWDWLIIHNTVEEEALWHNDMLCEKLLHFMYFWLALFKTLLYLSAWWTITCPTNPVPVTSLHTLRSSAHRQVYGSSLDHLQFINVFFGPWVPKLIRWLRYSPITAKWRTSGTWGTAQVLRSCWKFSNLQGVTCEGQIRIGC